MRDLSPEVKEALEAVCSNVFYFYPDSFEDLPADSYYDCGNSSDGRDDKLTSVVFHVDSWALTIPELKALIAVTDTAMRGLGFRRTLCIPVSDPSGYRHQAMKFEGTFNSIDGKLYSQ